MTKLFFWVISLLFLFSACSPRITTQVLRSYPPLDKNHPVIVYELGEAAPDSALVIGTFSVTDRGTTTGCNYPQVVNYAVETARNIGGDALKITEHAKPHFWGSSCHQIWGFVLRLDEQDSLVNSSSFRQQAGKEIENINQGTVFEKIPGIIIDEIGINIGYGSVIDRTKGLSGEEKRVEDELSNGLTWDAYYLRVYPSTIGWGIMYSGYKSSTSYQSTINDVMLTYIAPMVVFRNEMGKWAMKSKLGLGYLMFRNKVSEGFLSDKLMGYTVGMNANLGVDYRISDNFLLGLELSSIIGSFSKLTSEKGLVSTSGVSKAERMGVSRINIMLGMRYCF